MNKIFTTLAISASLLAGSQISHAQAWTSHNGMNNAPAQVAETRAGGTDIFLGHCSVNDYIYPYDGISLSYDARVGVGMILTKDMFKQYIGATIVGMYVGWDDQYSTSNYECFVRDTNFGGTTLTQGSDDVQFGWNYVSLESVKLTEDFEQLAVGFYTDLVKDVCSIPKFYPTDVPNSTYLWSGEVNNAGEEVWYDTKEVGVMPIVLVLQDTDGLFHNMIRIDSLTTDVIVGQDELQTAIVRLSNTGTNSITNIEFTTSFGDKSHTEIIDFSTPLSAQQGGKVLLPVAGLGSGIHKIQVTAVNGMEPKASNAVEAEIISVSDEIASKYVHRPLVEYFISEDNYMTVTYVDDYFYPGFEPYKDQMTLVMPHLDDKFMTGDNDALEQLITMAGGDKMKVSVPAMSINRSGYSCVAQLNSLISGTPMMYTIFPDYIGQVYDNVLSHPTFASVEAKGLMDANGAISINVSGVVEEGVMPQGEDLYLTVYLMERDVWTEDQRFWDDKAAAEKGGEYIHKNIIREILTPYWGEKLEKTGGEYSMTFNTEYYEEWVKENLYVVAFLNRGVENNQLALQVINSTEGELEGASINRVENFNNVVVENANGTITVNGNSNVEVYNLSGCRVDNNNLSAGLYIVKAEVEGQSVTQKILVK
ncbi:MAG: Omp28-related outer membrane protein [Muribaculaceae bacterium]|nr:Omp28-related outer membrane protein [Muribaculaceae bacterium]